MAYTMPQQITKNSANLSKLTKGVGEFYDEEKRVEIVLDENHETKNKISKLMVNVQPTNFSINSKQEISLPKTFTTRKGALILFSEEIFAANSNNDKTDSTFRTRELEEPSKSTYNENNSLRENTIKTVNDLQRNVLYYGITPKDKVPYVENENQLRNMKNFVANSLTSFEDSNNMESTMFSLVNISTKNLLTGKINMDIENGDSNENSLEDKKLLRINRGLSAKRYLNNLTKHWDQNVLDTFISDGKIKPTDTSNKNERKSSKRKHIDDDLTVWPQAYRFDSNWSAGTVDMRSYRFLKAQDFNLSKDDPRIETSIKYNSNEELDKPSKRKSARTEPIKIFDPQHQSHEVDYKSLATEEKEKVLSELLFHSALNNIKQQNLDDLNSDTISYSVEKNLNNTKPIKTNQNLNDNIEKTTNEISSSKLNQKSISFDINEKIEVSKADSKRTSQKTRSDYKPVYMFNKLPGAPWVAKKIPRISSEQIDSQIRPNQTSGQTSSKKSVITPVLQMENNSPVLRNFPNEKSRKTYLNRIMNSSFSSKKENILKMNAPNEIEMKPNRVQEVEVGSGKSDPVDSSPIYTQAILENEFSPRLIEADGQIIMEEDIKNNLEMSDRIKLIESIGHQIGTDEITPIEMYLEEMRSVADEFALDDNILRSTESFRMLKETSSKKQDEKTELLHSVIGDDTLSLRNELIMKADIPNESEVGKSFQQLQSIHSEDKPSKELKAASFASENSFDEAKRSMNLDRRLQRFTRPNNKKTRELLYLSENDDKNVTTYRDKRTEKLSKFAKYENNLRSSMAEKSATNKAIAISETTTKLNLKKDTTSSSPMPSNNFSNATKTQSNLYQGSNFPIAGNLQTNRELSMDNETSKFTLYDDKDDQLNDNASARKNIQIAPALRNLINESNDLNLKANANFNSKYDDESTLNFKEKLPLPKLHFNQDKLDKENNTLVEKKLPDEKKFKLVYLDDEYAKVETIKLKPKSINTPMQSYATPTNRKSAFENTHSSLMKRPELNEYKEEKTTFWNNWGNPNNIAFPTDQTVTYKSTEQPAPIKSTVKEEDKVQSRPKINLASLTKRKIDWSIGDFDPRECFCLWSYETPPQPVVVDRDFAAALKRYAQLLARVILGKKTGGLNLSDDIKRALKANIEKLIQALTHGKMSRELLDEYKKIFKSVLAKLLKRKDLDNLEISDEMLMKLLELPPEAFEIYLDPATGKETLRVRSAYLREQAKLVRNVVTEAQLSLKDFDSYIDPVTGEIKYKLKADVARKLGIPEGMEDMFEVYTDEHGNTLIRLKDGAKNITIGDTTYEMVIDPTTGKQVLRMVTKQKVGKETIEDIMRLAANMTPETRNRYFQELLKTAGATMSDELRQRIVNEMLKNAENLSAETRENLLKDLMTNLVNQLPPELAKKLLADIMKATENIDPTLKEKMLKNLIQDLDSLPDELKQSALKEIMKNMENLTAEQRQKLLENIMDKMDEMGISSKEADDIRNQVLKEMLINAKNFDEETRNRIIAQVLAKATADGGDVPQSVLEELVKQMSTLNPEFKNLILKEIQKSLESGNLDASVLAELLKNADELTPELLRSLVENADKMDSATLQQLIKNLDKLPDDMKLEVLNKMIDKMDSSTLQELIKNLDKLPDEMKKEMIAKMIDKLDSDGMQEMMKNLDKIPDDMKMKVIDKMFEKMDESAMKELINNLDKLSDEMKAKVMEKMLANLDNLSSEVQQKLLKELLANPSLIKDDALREKIIRDILKNMTVDDVLRDTANMTAEEKNRYYQELLMRAGDLSEETRQKLIELMLKNAENLDEKTRENLLNDFMKNVIKDLPPDVAAKVLADLMKSTEHLDSSLKQKMIENLLKNMDDLPPELKQQALGELMKNLDDLSAEEKQKIFNKILDSVDSLPPELRDKALKAMVENMNNLSSEAKNALLQNILEKVEKSGGDSEFKKTLRNEVIKEIIKNSQNLDAETRKKVLQGVMDKLGTDDVPDVIMQELIKQMDSLPDSIKKTVLNELVKNIEKGNIDPKVLEEMLKNSKNIPKELLEKLVANVKNLAPEALAQLVKNLDSLPEHLKQKALKDLLDNVKNLDPMVKKELLNELFKNPNLLKDRKAFESAVLGLLENMDNVPENVRRDMLKNIAKNIKNLSDETKAQVLKEVFNNLQNSSDETREDVLKQLLKKMGQKELEEWIRNSDMSEEMKRKMLADIQKIMENDDMLWDSDDEKELEGLSPEERARRKREIIERRKMGIPDDDKLGGLFSRTEKEVKRDLSWVKMKQKKVLAGLKINPNEPVPTLSDEQLDFIKAFNKLSDEEKAKLLEGMTDEERRALFALQQAYEKVRQQELTDTLAQAKNLALAKLRERLALQKRIEYLNLLRIESNMFQHAQQLTRAFVFSYYDLIEWLDVTPDIPVMVS